MTKDQNIIPNVPSTIASPHYTDAASPTNEASKNDPLDKKLALSVPKAAEVIRASAAVDLLEPLILGRARTKRELVDLARDGRLTCYALRYWTEKLDDPTAIWRHPGWKSQPQDNKGRKFKIPRKLWLKADALHDECLQWDWRQGRFFLRETLKNGKVKIHFIKGLWLLKDEVMDLKLTLSGGKNLINRGGRPIGDPPEWTRFWLEIASMAAQNEISSITGNRNVKLNRAVEDRFKKRGEPFPKLGAAILKQASTDILARFPAENVHSPSDLAWDEGLSE